VAFRTQVNDAGRRALTDSARASRGPKFLAYYYPHNERCQVYAARAARTGVYVGNELALLEQATPLFEGHQLPKYCLGRPDLTRWENTMPSAMDRQVEIAERYDIGFIFCTYVGSQNGTPVHEFGEPAELFMSMSAGRPFAAMACLDRPRAVLPIPAGGYVEPGRRFDLTANTARLIVDQLATKHWRHDDYLRVGGRPYLSIAGGGSQGKAYGLGGAQKRSALSEFIDELRRYSTQKYGIDPYLVGIIGRDIDTFDVWNETAVDAITSYASLVDLSANALPIQDYGERFGYVRGKWNAIAAESDKIFVPSVDLGWDASPRGEPNHPLEEVRGQYPYTPMLVGNTPEVFQNAVREATRFAHRVPDQSQIVPVFSFNEVAEGSALLPQTDGSDVSWAYLEALKAGRTSGLTGEP